MQYEETRSGTRMFSQLAPNDFSSRTELPVITTTSQDRAPPSQENSTRNEAHRLSDVDEDTAISEKDLLFFNEHMDTETADFLRLVLLEGRKYPGDCGVSLDTKPSWVDDKKIRLGQQFAMKYIFGVMFADVESLFLLYTLPEFLQPFIFSGNSDTPIKAFQRYLSTLLRVNTWYSGDLWEAGSKARRNLSVVRAMHDKIRRSLTEAPAAEIAQRTALKVAPWVEGVADALRKDYECAALGESYCPVARAISSYDQWVNQMEMSITQFMFVGVQVTYPEHFGTGGASEEELDAFVHLWRALGHLLGVEERFNFCAGGLDAARKRTKGALEVLMKPALAHVDATWEHMTRCLFSGLLFFSPGLSYEVALVHLCEAVGAAPPRRLQQRLTAPQRLQRRLLAWWLRWMPRVAPLRACNNWYLLRSLERANEHIHDVQWQRDKDDRVGYASFQKRQQRGNKATTSYLPLVTTVFTIFTISVTITIAYVYGLETSNSTTF